MNQDIMLIHEAACALLPVLHEWQTHAPLSLTEQRERNEKRLGAYLRPDLVIFDDFGLRFLRRRESEDLYEVINERYERGAILVTSNRSTASGRRRSWTTRSSPRPPSTASPTGSTGPTAVTITGPSYRAPDTPRPLGKDNGKKTTKWTTLTVGGPQPQQLAPYPAKSSACET
jgi:hypothetical protein